MHKVILSIIGFLTLFMMSFATTADETTTTPDSDFSLVCPDANILTNVFDQVCWDCFLDSISLMGVSIGDEPDGAASKGPFCACTDALGVPEIGFPLSFWRPSRVNEVVTTPWCSPGLGGIQLQNTMTGLGSHDTNKTGVDGSAENMFFQHHYFSYPLMEMLSMLAFPSCTDGYIDMDLMYISEVDPLWNDDLLSLILNPEAIIFANPLARLWCIEDCVSTTLNNQSEDSYGCAGCDGTLYPLTGNVTRQPDGVAASSLITQRVLAGLHRKGLAKKTIGNDAMCKPSYYPTIPRSQYKFSMMYPVPQASSNLAAQTVSTARQGGDTAGQYTENLAGSTEEAGEGAFDQCCHPMGMSTSRWCTPFGGRDRPNTNAYLYMIWNYRDCCVRGQGSSGE
jgi:conjugal transfer pilus assembly protein TraU